MVRDTVTGECTRADHLLQSTIDELIKSEKLSNSDIQEAMSIRAQVDSLTCTKLDEYLCKYSATFPETGPSGKDKGYLRPETAQGIFVNFKRLLEFNNGRLPFGAAQVGLAFRNEISPRSGLLRLREFTLAEIEYFIEANDPQAKRHSKFHTVRDLVMSFFPRDSQTSNLPCVEMSIGEAVSSGLVNSEVQAYFLARTHLFLITAGIKRHQLRFRQHLQDEMAHYACDCWDAEIETSYGWIECVGNADRSAYDLTVHSKKSGVSLSTFVEFEDGPKSMDVLEMIPNKSLIGKNFKSEGKQVLNRIEEINKIFSSQVPEMKNTMELEGSVQICGKSLTSEHLSFKNTTKKLSGKQVVPSVIEPSFGIGRIIYCIFEHAYCVRPDDSQKSYLALKPIVAPTKVSILPLMKKTQFNQFIDDIANLLTERGISHKIDDSSATIGKRYARTDEIGIPYAVTIDFTTLTEQTITLRERDSTRQVRIPINDLADVVFKLVYSITSWDKIESTYPKFESVIGE